MENSFVPNYDETKEMELIYDFHGSQIMRVNTTNANLFLEEGAKFDEVVVKKIDELARLRLIYVCDKIPPLSAIMKHIENPYNEVRWGVYAIVVPNDAKLLTTISPLIKYALNITKLKNKYAIKVFNYSHRNNLEEVIKWQDQNMDIKSESSVDSTIIGV